MAKVRFTSALKRFYPDLESMEIGSSSVKELILKLNARYPGLSDYLIDDTGTLRKHVNIFIGDAAIKDRINLSDGIVENDQIYIMQALSGG